MQIILVVLCRVDLSKIQQKKTAKFIAYSDKISVSFDIGGVYVYVSLYRRYRPQKFDELVGQSVAREILCNALRKGQTAHAYMFSGPRGCGKTTVARLLAKALNCINPENGEPCGVCESCQSVMLGKHLDVIEVDAASNRGIDEIRELKTHVGLAPFMGKKKIYIIDEVHMLTEYAANALLKTLEEPPASVAFILATTESHKVPVTIRSRCQHIPFHRIKLNDMLAQLSYVVDQEGASADKRALLELARFADGGLRDALSLLEQAIAAGNGNIKDASIATLLGGLTRCSVEEWIELLRLDPPKSMGKINSFLVSGVSAERLLQILIPILRDLWLVSLWGAAPLDESSLAEEEIAWLVEESSHWDAAVLRYYTEECVRLLPQLRYGMRAEVFSGVLQLIFSSRERPVVKTTIKETPLPTKTQTLLDETERSQEQGSTDLVKTDLPANQHELDRGGLKEDRVVFDVTGNDRELPSGFPIFLKNFFAEDLHLCVSMLHSEIIHEGDSWQLSRQNLTENERMVLDNPREKSLIATAILSEWGIGENAHAEPEHKEERTVMDKPQRAALTVENDAKEQSRLMPVGDNIEQLAAYLEAEILYVKPSANRPETDFENTEIIEPQGEYEE